MTTLAVSKDKPRLAPPWAALAGFAAGGAWLALGIESIANPGAENYRNAYFLVPWLTTVWVLAAVHQLHRASGSKLERYGLWITLAAIGIAVPGQFGLLADIAWLKAFAFAAVIPWIGGLALFGAGVFRARIAPKWTGLALALAQPGTMAMGLALSPWVPLENEGSYSGAIVHGAVFLALGGWLWAQQRREVD